MFTQFLLIGLFLLGLWAIANIILGVKKQQSSTGTLKYFWQMNALWNIVNAIIALGAIIFVIANYDSFSTNTSIQSRQIKIVAVNILFDIAYVAAGLWLEVRGKKQHKPRLIGYGSAIQLQGAFLFFFDSMLALALIIATL